MPRDKVFGSPHDDNIDFGDGSGWINAKPGNDVVTDNGQGGSRVLLGAGDDEAIYVHNGGGSARTYFGGSGNDTLTLSFTLDEWLSIAGDLQDEIDAFLAFAADQTNPSGQITGQWFNFDSLGLRIKQFENIRIVVDGQDLSPEDDPVDAVDDNFSTDDNVVLAAGSVLVNDSVPDLVGSVELVTPPPAGVLTFNADGTFEFDPDGQFDHLLRDEIETVSFTYRVTDADGDSDIATVWIDVVGTNTPPDAVDDSFSVPEAGLVLLDVLANDSDADGDSITITSLTQPAEGAVSIVGGMVQFDPGATFAGLSDGQTATVNFDYTISDGQETDTASVSVEVLGSGVFDPGLVSNSDSGSGANGQLVTATLTSWEYTNDGTVEASVNINFGAVLQPQINVVYVVDVSGSTGQRVIGATVGDVNGDGRHNTILDVEIAALQNLTTEIEALGFDDDAVTISVIPFSTDAQAPTTFTLGATQTGADVNAFLETLSFVGFTNYVDALEETATLLGDLTAANGPATNLVYFMSDGRPVPTTGQTVADIEAAAALSDPYSAQIAGFGIGNSVPPEFLDALDNTGGSETVSDPNDLDAALLGSPIPSSAIVDADVFIFNDAGTQIGAIDLDAGDFTAGPLGLSVDLVGISGLDAYLGDANRIDFEVQIDSDNDGTVDFTLTPSVDVFGVLPDSFDIV